MRSLAALALIGLVACTGSDGNGDPAEPATLTISYAWEGFEDMPEDNCASAWVDTLYVELEHAEGDYNLRQVACDNDPIEIPDLRAGAWMVEVRTVQYTDEAAASYGQSEILDIDLPGGEVTEVDMAIVCHEKDDYTCDRSE